MANVPLKSIKFPNLDNTYTVPQIDDTLALAGLAADSKAVGDKFTETIESIPEIDDTLAVTGKAADAKATGDKISGVASNFAPEFSTSNAYVAGDYVTYEGAMYRFVKSHTAGSWVASDVIAVSTGDEIKYTKSAVCDIVSIPTSDWGAFAITATSGFPNTSAKRITTNKLLDNVAWIHNSDTTNYWYALAAYDRNVGTYVGIFNGSGYSQGLTWIKAETFNIPTYDYKYLIILRKASDGEIAVSDGSVITLGKARYLNPTSQEMGYGSEYSFEIGGITPSTGAENTFTTRARTGFIPIEGAAGSSVDVRWNINMLDTYMIFSIVYYKDGSLATDASITWGLDGIRIPVSDNYNQVRLVFKRRDGADFTSEEVAGFKAYDIHPYDNKNIANDIEDLKKRVAILESIVINDTTPVSP